MLVVSDVFAKATDRDNIFLFTSDGSNIQTLKQSNIHTLKLSILQTFNFSNV